MNKPRELHGTICADGSLYAFGGVDYLCEVGINSAEQLLIHANELFRMMSGMMRYGRKCINPCRRSQDIYLALGGHPSVEVFSIITRQFRCLTAKLPENGPCLAVVDSDALILVTNVRRYRVNIATGAVEEPVAHTPLSSVTANSVSLLYEGIIYAVIREEIWAIDPENGERKEIVGPGAVPNNNKHFIIVPNTHARPL
jgi:hypothetical protein